MLHSFLEKGSCTSWGPLRSRQQDVMRQIRDLFGGILGKDKEGEAEGARESLPP